MMPKAVIYANFTQLFWPVLADACAEPDGINSSAKKEEHLHCATKHDCAWIQSAVIWRIRMAACVLCSALGLRVFWYGLVCAGVMCICVCSHVCGWRLCCASLKYCSNHPQQHVNHHVAMLLWVVAAMFKRNTTQSPPTNM